MATAEPPQAELGTAPAEHGVGRNTAYSLLTQVSTAAGTAVLTLYLVRALGPHEFGIFSLAVGIGTLVMLPADFGISQSAARFVAENRGRMPRVAEVLADGFRLKLAIGVLVSVVLVALAGPIASAYGQPALAWPIRWMALATFAQSMMLFYRYAYGSLRRLSIGFRITVAESFAETSVSIVLVVLAGGAAAATAGRAVGYGIGVAVAIVITLRMFGGAAFRHHADRGEARKRLMRYAGALLIIDAAFALSSQLAPLMIGGILGVAAVGIYQAPARLIVFLQYPGLAVANAVAPGLARGEHHEPDVRTFGASLRHLIVFQGLLLAPVIVWARPIVDLLLGPGYGQSAEVLRALAPYIFFAGLAPLVSLGANYLGEARLRVPVSILDVVLGAALTVALLEGIGLVGAAIASDVTAAIYVPLNLLICRRLIDLPIRPLMLSLVRTLTAAAAMAAVLFAFGTNDLSVFDWLIGGACGLAAFVLATLATGELRVADLRELGRRVRLRLRSRGD